MRRVQTRLVCFDETRPSTNHSAAFAPFSTTPRLLLRYLLQNNGQKKRPSTPTLHRPLIEWPCLIIDLQTRQKKKNVCQLTVASQCHVVIRAPSHYRNHPVNYACSTRCRYSQFHVPSHLVSLPFRFLSFVTLWLAMPIVRFHQLPPMRMSIKIPLNHPMTQTI